MAGCRAPATLRSKPYHVSEVKSKPSIQELLNTIPQTGEVKWIGVRPGRKEPIKELNRVRALVGQGLEGDRFSG